MGHDPHDNIVFMACDLKFVKNRYQLYVSRIESSNVKNLFDAFRNRSVIPSKDAFVDGLRQRIKSLSATKKS